MDEVLSKVKRLSNAKIAAGRTPKEALAYKGVSLWWFIENSIYTDLKKPRERKAFGFKIPAAGGTLATKTFLIAKLFVRYVAAILAGRRPRAGGKKIFVSNSLWHWREIWDSVTLKQRKGDAIIGNVVDWLKREGFDVIGIDRDDGQSVNMKALIGKMAADGGMWRPIEAYLTAGIVKNALEGSSAAEHEWRAIARDGIFKKLPASFNLFFTYHSFQAIAYFEMARRAMEIEKPQLVLLAGEHSDSGRAMVAAARLAGVPTIAVQHGFHSHSNVMYFKEQSSRAGLDFVHNTPTADKRAMSGTWIKSVLIKHFNYPPSEVVVTGQPRYDILAKANRVFSRKKFCSKFGVDGKNKIVLIVTQPFTFGKRELFLRNVLDGLKTTEGISIVIKPHPAENEEWHRKIAREQAVDTVVLPKSSDTYEALYACDTMITSSSTTALEAMIMGKSVVIADWLNDPWAKPFVNSGSVISVNDKSQLAAAVRKALHDKQIRKRLAPMIKKFVYEQTYKQDGRATERVVALAKGMIREKGG